MRKYGLLAALLFVVAMPGFAQSQVDTEAEIRAAVPYSRMLSQFPDLTLTEYNTLVRRVARERLTESPALAAPSYLPPQRSLPTYTPPRYAAPRADSPPPTQVPRAGSTYDWQSGNTYLWRRDSLGQTHVNGFNANGSTWSQTIKPNGSQSGFDAKANYWTYDANSKVYMNLGTGETCVGTGAARICTGGR